MNFNKQIFLLRTIVIVLYSVVVIASSTPRFGNISNLVVIVYYLLVPGYVISFYFGENHSPIERVALSVILGLTLYLVVFSFRQIIVGAYLPFDVIIPSISILLVLLDQYRSKPIVVSRSVEQ